MLPPMCHDACMEVRSSLSVLLYEYHGTCEELRGQLLISHLVCNRILFLASVNARYDSLKEKCTPQGVALLEGVTLLEKVYLEAGFGVSYAKVIPSVTHFSCLWIKV